MLAVFCALSQGKALKEIVLDMGESKDYESRVRSLSVQIGRFSEKVFTTFCSQCAAVKVPESILQEDAHERCWPYLSSLFGNLEEWPGVELNNREHGYALCEALRYYAFGKAKEKPS